MSTTADFEKLGVFYLGRPYDLAAKKPKDGLLLYDSKDLVTHAVCVGMTGSGKTGLCLSILEEAALDGIPAILIDPKGDLGNLLLTFPDLRPEDFAPWINEEDAGRKGVSPEEYARQQAELWRTGLAAWGQDGQRIRRLREAVDLAIYTPGSTAGFPVSILASFAAPAAAVREDAELLRERVAVTATSLLGLLAIEADPIRSREHILLSSLLSAAWGEGRDLDLATLIQQIQTPPMARVGVLDLETFYPSKARFELAMALNNLLAAPGFTAWMEGEPLDPARLLHTPDGKPRLSIISIAHLGDSERMFIVSLLLNQVAGWVRTQSGTTSLRAILYMDEIFGYFPPVANPPSKLPLLTLLKQARAFGLGVVLATQNPVDLDYKGLSNTGTWFLGRLQTERDKARVLEGLEGVAAGAGKRFDSQALERTLAGLGNRVFLMNNVHDDVPEIFETRWAMSYLRGPLTRNQIKILMAPRKAAMETAPSPHPVRSATARSAPASRASGSDRETPEPSAPAVAIDPSEASERDAGAARAHQATAGAMTADSAASPPPALPPDVPQYFVPLRGDRPTGATLVYQPALIGSAQIRFADAKKGIEATQDLTVLTPITGGAVAVDWETAREVDLVVGDLEREPADGARFGPLPAMGSKPKSYPAWSRDFTGWLYRTRTLELLKSPTHKVVSRPGETEGEFRVRVREATHEGRDVAADKIRKKYAPKIASLQDRIRRAEHAVARESEQSSQAQVQTAISLGATLIGAFLGRKAVSATTLGRATTAVRGAGRAVKERQDIGRAQENVAALQQQLADLEAEFRAEAEKLGGAADPTTETFETIAVRPQKQNIAVKLVALAWTPWWERRGELPAPAWV